MNQWWKPENFGQKTENLRTRMVLIRSVRKFFEERDFWEVETPILQVCPVMDTHILGIKADIRGVDKQIDRTRYLHTSPEFAMKKLLVAGLPKIFQICHVFRDAEASKRHSVEFTMIEWYRAEENYKVIMQDCVDLLRFCAKELGIKAYSYRDKICDPFRDWEIISVDDAFRQYAGIKLSDYLDDAAGFNQAIQEIGIRTAPGDAWDDLFFRVMDALIEPKLGNGVPTILCDYPVSLASLARRKPEDSRFAERFELYVCGVEVANAFGELTNAAEQEVRFAEELALKEQLYGDKYPVDQDFLDALKFGMPESSGIALGIDRLVMLAVGTDDIDQVLWTEKP
ncbi:MAG: EF-P lysine aminoacylase GenX [Micavibrio aeruginosavorus]|uniref:EF-P lysine aminoacylase GenX n=1 Tax=Micavibrio aeruginosavorus TaxID=349221 RepID=A0A2W5HE10_9BACT|nr:MAG: EF-P lysine aminoacylase GenX [Micavibrio aeruginosavorus]